ncbi:MAG: 4'-phosphopantetheinyl transferase superfamily protein [Myxococcales bacterium]|nr:4'-phosphopantetheinyl transferase superfamily protein [Myxococcales bacterium]
MFRWTVTSAAERPELGEGRPPAGFLSPAETDAFSRLLFPARRRKWLLGRWAAKRLLLEELRARDGREIPPTALTIANEPDGMPYAVLCGLGRLAWSFSISHREKWGFCAVSFEPGLSLGADLELVQPREPALVRQFFTEDEAAAVAAAGPSAEKVLARIWSAKEAVLKSLQVGLRLDTRGVRVGGEGQNETGRWPAGWSPLAVSLAREVAAAAPGAIEACWRDEGRYVLTVALAPASPRGEQG